MNAVVVVIIILLVFVALMVVIIEYDRRAYFTVPADIYYKAEFPRPILGMYNGVLRLASLNHKPIEHDVDKWFPESAVLRHNWIMFAAEALAVHRKYELRNFHDATNSSYNISNGQWKVLIIKWYDNIIESSAKMAPRTCQVVAGIPNMRSCMFSILQPRSQIPTHKGPYIGGLRYHLGLKIPRDRERCYITVNGTKYHWKNGDDIVFDDTYDHSVVNDTDEVRIIMFCDFDRPMVAPFGQINTMMNNNATMASWVRELNTKSEEPIPTKKSAEQIQNKNEK